MTVSPMLLAGRYRLLDPLGTGGMGRVWLARDEVLRRDVAIKEVSLPLDLAPAERDELRIRTLREARTAARLSHPNVVQIYDVLGFDDRPWIVMEYVRSRSLQQILAQDGPLHPQRAARIGLAILAALVAAHYAGVLHRDVKPGNVLIADDDRVVLTDFGLATFDGGESAVTRPGLVWGSPEYVAPERAKDGTSSVEADMWSLGATLFAAVEGSSPYARTSAMATLTALAMEKPPVPQRAGPLRPVLMGLLRKDPRARMRPVEVERLLRRVAGPISRSRTWLLPRQRKAPAAEAGPGTTAEASEQTPVVPITSYALPEPPTEVIADAGPAGSAASMRQRWWLRGRPGQRGRPGLPGRRGWLVAAALVATTAAVAAVAIYRTGDTPRAPGTGAGVGSAVATSPAPSVPAEPSMVPSSGPRPGENLLPQGWAYFRDSSVFRIAVPIGWIVEPEGTTIRFREPNTVRRLAVEVMPVPPDGALAWTRTRDKHWAGGDGPPDYHLIRLNPVVMGDGGAEWEYSFTDPRAGSMQVINRCFTAGARAFAISWTTPAYDAGSSRLFFDLAVGGFAAPR